MAAGFAPDNTETIQARPPKIGLSHHFTPLFEKSWIRASEHVLTCVCACVCVCVRACVCLCVCVAQSDWRCKVWMGVSFVLARDFAAKQSRSRKIIIVAPYSPENFMPTCLVSARTSSLSGKCRNVANGYLSKGMKTFK